jgi:hypothetical protein
MKKYSNYLPSLRQPRGVRSVKPPTVQRGALKRQRPALRRFVMCATLWRSLVVGSSG